MDDSPSLQSDNLVQVWPFRVAGRIVWWNWTCAQTRGGCGMSGNSPAREAALTRAHQHAWLMHGEEANRRRQMRQLMRLSVRLHAHIWEEL